VGWYERRWVVEDYHQCLKTGCRLEECQVQTAARLLRLLGLLSELSVRLLQLRDLARRDPERSAREVLNADVLAIALILSHLTNENLFETVSQISSWMIDHYRGHYVGH
jgi:hypothetical protein